MQALLNGTLTVSLYSTFIMKCENYNISQITNRSFCHFNRKRLNSWVSMTGLNSKLTQKRTISGRHINQKSERKIVRRNCYITKSFMDR